MGHRESGHRAAEDPTVHGAPTLGGRYLLQVDSVQEADPAVGQHALEAEPRAVQERQPVRCVGRREASEGRELLYSIPTALCEEIASAATAELADRLSIPD